MDALSQILEPVSARGAVFCHGPVKAPWRFEGGAAGRCLFHCVLEGRAWLDVGGSAPHALGAGDIVLIPRGGRHHMGSAKHGRGVPLGEAVTAPNAAHAFSRFCVGGDGLESRLICGSFELDGLTWHPLLRALPETVIVNVAVGRWLSPTLASLERYVQGNEPGAELITRRLTEVLLVQTLAAWLEGKDLPEGFLRALADPQLGRALGRFHGAPESSMGIDDLARVAGLSRSSFFERFKRLVGESPARYVQKWRLNMAARALERDDLSVAEICERVGYQSVPSFTNAFRRHHGLTPAAYRRAQKATSSSSHGRGAAP